MAKSSQGANSFAKPLGFALAVAIAIPGAFLFDALNVPLAFMLGPMVFCTLASIARLPLAAYPRLRPLVLSVVGIAIASGVTSETPAELVKIAPSLAGLVLCTVLSAALSIFYCRIAGFDMRTALFSGMPGGLAEMVEMGARHGANVQSIALFHSSRVLFIVLSLPVILSLGGGLESEPVVAGRLRLAELSGPDVALLLALAVFGAMLGRAARLPAGHLTGPLFVTAMLRGTGALDVVMPLEPLLAAQFVLGTVTGASFAGVPPRTLLCSMLVALGSVVLLLAVLVGTALGTALLLGADFRILVLSYSPGGLSEASILALMISPDVTAVALHHIARVLIVLFGTSLLVSLLRIGPPARQPEDTEKTPRKPDDRV